MQATHREINENDNKYLPILMLYNNGSNVETIEIEGLEDNTKVKAIVKKYWKLEYQQL